MTERDVQTTAYGSSDRASLRIALIYMLTGVTIFLSMGLLGLVMRLDHAGWWVISPDWFYRIMTIHGVGMVSGMLLATMGAMIAGLSRQVKLSARWLWTAYLVYSLSLPLLLYAVLIGRFAGAWTALDPLPFHGLTWDKWAGSLVYVSFLCVGLGLAIYCTHLLAVLRRFHGGIGNALGWRILFNRGQADPNRPDPKPVELAAMAGSIIGLITAVVGLAVLVPLLAEAAGVLDHINHLYTKNFIMFFGHAIANLAIYFAIGVIYSLIPVLANRGGESSRLVVLAWNLTIILVITPTSHHLYQDFAQPFGLEFLGQLSSWSVVPEVLLITIIGSLSHFFRSGMRWSVPSILVVIGLFGWVFGGIGGVIDASMAANNLTHNTLWVPAHFHTYYIIGVVAFVLAFLFYLIGDLSGVKERPSSKIAAWLFGVGGVGFVLMFFLSGAKGVPRRYAVHLPEWQIFDKIAVPFVILIALCLLWLIADMARGLLGAWRKTGSSGPDRSVQ